LAESVSDVLAEKCQRCLGRVPGRLPPLDPTNLPVSSQKDAFKVVRLDLKPLE
jgi:hypothetical protein